MRHCSGVLNDFNPMMMNNRSVATLKTWTLYVNTANAPIAARISIIQYRSDSKLIVLDDGFISGRRTRSFLRCLR